MEKISEYEERIKKLEELKKQGINPYPPKANRTHIIKNVLDNFERHEKEKTEIILAGRLRSARSHGNLSFGNIQDVSGKIQIAISKKRYRRG